MPLAHAAAVTETDFPESPPPPTRNRSALWLLALLLLALVGWRGWVWWSAKSSAAHAAFSDVEQRIAALESRLDSLRRDQRGQGQRLQQADATNRVLRDELLGIGQRAALLEDSVSKLADPDRHGAQALRLDETELLLVMGQQRLLLAADLDGARRAYALAAGVLGGIEDPAYLSLRQTLIQERAALDALGIDPRVQAQLRLDAFARTLQAAPHEPLAPGMRRPWWQRLLGSLDAERTEERAVLDAGADRATAQAALQLELSLARAAAERRDAAAYRASLARADAWLQRLWPPSPGLQRQRAQLRALAAMPLSPDLATLGSTLQQLRQRRAAR